MFFTVDHFLAVPRMSTQNSCSSSSSSAGVGSIAAENIRVVPSATYRRHSLASSSSSLHANNGSIGSESVVAMHLGTMITNFFSQLDLEFNAKFSEWALVCGKAIQRTTTEVESVGSAVASSMRTVHNNSFLFGERPLFMLRDLKGEVYFENTHDVVFEPLRVLSCLSDKSLFRCVVTVRTVGAGLGDFRIGPGGSRSPCLQVLSWGIFVHSERFHAAMQHSSAIVGLECFVNTITNVYKKQRMSVVQHTNFFNTRFLDVTSVRLPSVVHWKLDLRPSQVQSLMWMQQFEDVIQQGQNYLSVPLWFPLPSSTYIMMLDPNVLVHEKHLVELHRLRRQTIRKVFYHGGFLADEMGSGKTAVVLALIVSTLGEKQIGSRQIAEGTTPPSQCGAFEQGVDDLLPVELNFKCVKDALSLIPVKATLIIIPMNLAHQWFVEIEKFIKVLPSAAVTGQREKKRQRTTSASVSGGRDGAKHYFVAGEEPPRVKSLCIFNKRHYTNVSFQDVMSADIVITTVEFLTGHALPPSAKTTDFYQLYKEKERWNAGIVTRDSEHKRTLPEGRGVSSGAVEGPAGEGASAAGSETTGRVSGGPAPVMSVGINLNNFLWKRIVLDEQHATSTSIPMNGWNQIYGLKGQVYWGVTATPIPAMLHRVLHIRPEDFGNLDVCMLLNQTVRRSPFVSSLPPFRVVEHYVDISQREREILHTYRHEGLPALVQLSTCFNVLALFGSESHLPGGGVVTTHSDIQVLMTFEELSKVMVTRRATQIKEKMPEVELLRKVIDRDNVLLRHHIESLAVTGGGSVALTGNVGEDASNVEEECGVEESKTSDGLNEQCRNLAGVNNGRERDDLEEGEVEEGDVGGEDEEGGEVEGDDISRVIRRRIKCNERKFELLNHKLNGLVQQCTFFQNQIELDEQERICPICITNVTNVITKCGHWFCRECCLAYMNSKPSASFVKCPLCKISLSRNEWIQEVKEKPVASTAEARGSGSVGTVEALTDVQKFGSKLAAIVALLREIRQRGEKAIMFVQWSDLMRTIRTILMAGGVKIAAVTGNTNTRNSAIERLKSGDVDVLLLSMDISTTGLNLVEANHVLFAHALVGGSPSTQRDSISQAVARVYRMGQTKEVQVHWFVTRGTDEERLFASNQS